MNISHNLKAVLFDIDDTLFDRKSALKEILRGIIKKLPDIFYGIEEEKVTKAFLEADRFALEEFTKGASGGIVREKRSLRFLSILGLSGNFSNTITTMYIDAYPGVSASVRDARPVVEKLAEMFPLGIISNGFPDIQYKKLESLGIRDLFQSILLSEEIGIRKPDRAIFDKAARHLGMQTEECFFVGDSYDTDIVGAKKSGMKACWLNRNGKEIVDEDVVPDFEIAELSELLDILA